MSELLKVVHSDLVRRLSKPGKDILEDLTERNYAMLVSIATHHVSSGDLMDAAKKQAIYGQQGLIEWDYEESALCDLPLDDVTPEQADMLHMAIGLAGEACELLDTVLKHVVDNEPLDVENLIEESGDISFFHTGLRHAANMTRDEALQANIEKLQTRYPVGYTNEAAQQRADKAHEEG